MICVQREFSWRVDAWPKAREAIAGGLLLPKEALMENVGSVAAVFPDHEAAEAAVKKLTSAALVQE
jgi:hypothetical protein